ncbi:MAG: DNA-directed RNA polymerase subunit alpha [bacterium]
MSIPLPNKIEIIEDKTNPRIGTVIIEPCYPGYSITIGNALRRVLLASLEGAAVTNMKIKGAQHEFSTIPHVKEDVLEIILRLKKIRFKMFKDEPIQLTLNVKGEKEVTAGDIQKNSDIEIINPELVIASLTNRNAELDMQLTVEKGLGYISVDQKELQAEGREIGNIAVDSLFTPIVNVGMKVENVRVGQMTNYEKLILTIETDGTIAVKDAVEKSSRTLINHFELLAPDRKENKEEEKIEEAEDEVKEEKKEGEKKKTKKSDK